MDTGTADNFLARELKPEALEAAAAKAGFPLTSRMQARAHGAGMGAPLTLPRRGARLGGRAAGPAHTHTLHPHSTPQEGYDHSYFFISTFMEDHVNFHADALAA